MHLRFVWNEECKEFRLCSATTMSLSAHSSYNQDQASLGQGQEKSLTAHSLRHEVEKSTAKRRFAK